MGQLINLLLESLSIYEMEVLIKTSTDSNKVDIYNAIRGLKNVVVVKVEQNDYLDSKKTNTFEYSLLHMKYIAYNDPKKDMLAIKSEALISSKIKGLLQFIPRFNTMNKIKTY
jgi:hypothetical protein